MSSRQIKKSSLLLTSSGSDVQTGGGKFTITGLDSVRFADAISISQIKYRAEVAQVVRVGTSSYTPTASTLYTVAIGDPIRTQSSVNQAPVRTYSYKTPPVLTTIGASAALQREYIHGQLVAKINADLTDYVTAASLTSGNGFSVTDNGNYYHVFAQGMSGVKGVSQVYTIPNEDGTGFASTDYAVYTTGVYSFGTGAKLLAAKPVLAYAWGGSVVSGIIDAPPVTTSNQPAVSGQNYDGWVIEDYKLVDGITLGGQLVYQSRIQYVFVDNGTGSSTTNLAGFKAFERAMLEVITKLYTQDTPTIYYMGDTSVVSQGLGTGLPSGVAQAENVCVLGNGFTAHYSPIATSTILALVGANAGIGLILDQTASEGVEFSAPTWANSTKSFIVGKTAFSLYAKITIDDVSGLNPMWVGFRKKEAYNATFTAYTDYAVIGLGSGAGDIYTNTELNSGGNTATDTTQNWADGETHQLEVRVDITGAVTFFIDGYKPTVTQAFTFDAGDEVIPTIYALQTADIGTPSLLEFIAVASDSYRA